MEFLRACFFMIWTSTCATFVDVDTSCNKNSIGKTVCYLESSRFDEYQWGICVTNEYLQVYSKGKYLCEHHYPYCHLHCMLEQHSILRGPVYEECRCRPDTSISHKSSVLLPHSCYIPRHNDCSWFGNCVKLRYECADLDLSNVVEYVQGECEMYNGVFQALSKETRKFIRDIHTCLEISLISILKPFQNISCQNIEYEVLLAYKNCFSNTSAICHLPNIDVWRLFWTMTSSFRNKADFVLHGILYSKASCFHHTNISQNVLHDNNIMKVVILTRVENRQRVKKSAKNSYQKWFQFHNKDIVNTLAGEQNWYQKGIIWYTLPLNLGELNMSPRMKIEMLIADQSLYDLNNSRNTSANLTEEIEDMSKSIASGELGLVVDHYTLQVMELKVCNDTNCQYKESMFGERRTTEKVIADCDVKSCSNQTAVVGGALGGSVLLVLSIILIVITYRYRKRLKRY